MQADCFRTDCGLADHVQPDCDLADSCLAGYVEAYHPLVGNGPAGCGQIVYVRADCGLAGCTPSLADDEALHRHR